MSEEEACDICDGGQSSKKNPIIFCDGEGCNLPVHKICYKVDEIPEDDWYCQRCVAKRRKKTINIICCPKQTGALKQTIVSDSYMHVVCAMWNKTIKDDMEPYSFNKKQLDLQECYICSKKKGICIECEDPSCNSRFHATCAINNGLLVAARNIPSDYSPKCSQHQPKPKAKPKQRKSRVIRRRKEISSSEEESEEESEHEDEEEESDEDDEEEDEEEEEEQHDESEEEMGNKNKKGKPVAAVAGTKRKQPPSSLKGGPPQAPEKKKSSPHALFAKDQMSTDEEQDDDEDDMGTRSSSSTSSSKLKRFRIEPNENTSSSSSSTASLNNAPPQSYRERLEAKRKKTTATTETKVFRLDTEKPSSSSSSSPKNTPLTIAPIATKQKLPNKAHLATAKPQRPHSMTPPNKKFGGNGANHLDIDAITNTMSNSQRWNNNASGVHTQPTTPHSTSASPFFDNDKMLVTPRKSIDDWNRPNGNGDELMRLRDDVRKLNEFKKAVAEIFTSLKITVPGAPGSPAENIEVYVNELLAMLKRVGPIREEDDAIIRDCVNTVWKNKK